MANRPGVTDNLNVGKATVDERQAARDRPWRYAQPAGKAVNMHKTYRTGASRTESEDAALTTAQVERKER